MKTILKYGLASFIGALVVLVAMNWSTIKRLKTINTLFDADRIVDNFSHMDAAFLHHDLKIAAPQPWPEDIRDLPSTVDIAGVERPLTEVLSELDTTGLVIIQDGKLIHESYYLGTERDDLRISWSVAKSFMSGLYGQALESGQIESLDDPVTQYVPALSGSAYDGATIRNVLNMASGITFDENYMDPKSDINDMGKVLGLGGSMDDYTAGLTETDVPAGTRWQYVSIDTHVAAMVLRAATGKSLHTLWEETYGEHLGMGRAPFYLTDGEDVAFALGGLNLRTRDYAKFGQLFLQSGEWNGEQIIPAGWVAESTKHSAPNLSDRGVGYGYQWWVPMPQEGRHNGDFFAVGIYGQYIYVNPRAGIVIAKNAADREFAYADEVGTHSMNKNIALMRGLVEKLSKTSSVQFVSADCQMLKAWVCQAEILVNGETKLVDISGVIRGNIGKVGPTGNYTKQIHTVTNIERLNDSDVVVTVESQLWLDGQKNTVVEPLLIRDGVPIYR